MASEEKAEGKGFTVQDRRRFSPETGEARPDAAESSAATAPVSASSEAQDSHAHDEHAEPLPEIKFSTFVISLSTQALMHLGEVPSPVSGKLETDVPAAKQMIDLLAMLRDKTRGNLDGNEDRLMDDVLFDLRMKYVEAVKKR